MTIIAHAYLREWREYKGLTCAAVARKVRCSTSEISRLETGVRRIDVDWLNAYARALGLANTLDLFQHPSQIDKRAA